MKNAILPLLVALCLLFAFSTAAAEAWTPGPGLVEIPLWPEEIENLLD